MGTGGRTFQREEKQGLGRLREEACGAAVEPSQGSRTEARGASGLDTGPRGTGASPRGEGNPEAV